MTVRYLVKPYDAKWLNTPSHDNVDTLNRMLCLLMLDKVIDSVLGDEVMGAPLALVIDNDG